MTEQEKDSILKMLVQAVMRANHILMACEMAKEDENVNGISMPLKQMESLGRTLGSVAMAFTKTGLFEQEEIERLVVEQTRVQDAMNLTMQLITQGADDDVIELALSAMGYDAGDILQVIAEAKKLLKHIAEEHPEMLPVECEHPFKQFVSGMVAPSTDTKH
jgi:ATP-dependent DNA ligase